MCPKSRSWNINPLKKGPRSYQLRLGYVNDITYPSAPAGTASQSCASGETATLELSSLACIV